MSPCAHAFIRPPQPQSDQLQYRKIEPSHSIESTLAASQSHHYEISLVKDQYLLITLTSETNVFKVGILIDDKPLANDGGLRAPSNLIVSLIAPETANYRIGVTFEGPAPFADYKLLVTTPQNPPPDFFARARAQQLLTELSALLYDQRNKAAFLKMTELGEESARLFAQLGMLKPQADALNLVGEAWRLLDESAKAIEAFDRTVIVSRALRYHAKTAEVLTFAGMSRYQVSDYRRAAEDFRAALPEWKLEEAGERLNMSGWTRVQLGNTALALGEAQTAIETFEQAAELYRRYYEPRIGIDTGTKEWHFGTATCLYGIGKAHAHMGQKQQALDALTNALEHYRAEDDGYYEPIFLNGLGELYASLGEYDQARALYEQALKLETQMASRGPEAQTLYLMGQLHKAAGELDAAEKQFNQSLEIRRVVSDRRGEAVTLNALGEMALMRGEARQALAAFEQALAIQREIGDRYGEGVTLGNVGAAYAALNDATRAADALQQSLVLRRALGDREGEANGLYQLARLAYAQGQMDEAQLHLEGALKQTELIRVHVLSPELRASYLGTVGDYYELYVEVLMRLHERRPNENYERAALQASEMARARSLLDNLVEARADIRVGVPADLLARERELSQRLQAKTEYHLRLQTGRHTAEQLAEAVREVQTIRADYLSAQARIKAASPRYAALTQPEPLGSEAVQALLDDETVLLEYALGERRSFVWAATRAGVASAVLPGRAEINAAARRAYDLLIARNQFVTGESSAQRRARIARADAEFPPAAAALSRMVLAPVAAHLRKPRVVVVAQEGLQFIPFAVLPEPITTGKAKAVKLPAMLIDKHEVVHLPSASALAQLRQTEAAPPVISEEMRKEIAVIADPVFSANDVRVVSAVKAEAVLSNRTLLRALNDFSDTNKQTWQIPRLPGTRAEADLIAALVPAAAQLRATDFAANRALVSGERLQAYRLLHFATHGLINTVHPELSGLVLSLVDAQGRAQDGFLPAHEIYNLSLQADVAVLSACQTGLGQQMRGEGLVGMMQGFFYAGASRVVVSLWAQQDKATADLMKRFYQRVLNEKTVTPAAALRAAQLEMRNERRWPAPYFWAGFTLQGEWR